MKKGKSARSKRRRLNRSDRAPTLLTKSAFAETSGRTRSAISHACEPRGPLAPAVCRGKIDINHAAAIEYLGDSPHGPRRAELLDLQVRRRRAEVARAEIALAEQQGKVIPRSGVVATVFGYLDSLGRRLLTDAARTIVARVYTLARGGAPQEEARREVVAIISAQLTTAKRQVADALRGHSK